MMTSKVPDEATPDSRRPQPLVSIGVPVYNGMPYLCGALDSLLTQDEPDIEVVISDNASDDGTEEYCRALVSRDSRVRYFRNNINVGAASNFQSVLSLSSAPLFAWAAHDDVYRSDFISKCRAVLQARPDSVLCVPAHRRISETGELISVRYEPPGLASPDLEIRLRAHLSRRAWLTIYGLWRKDVLMRIGPPLPIWGSDVNLVWRALLLGPIETIREPLGDYRVFREKTADATVSGLTGERARVHLPSTRMLRDLKRASEGLELPEGADRTASHVLRWWVFTHHYRELAFADLWVESRRFRAEGAPVRALALLLPMALLSPRMGVNGLRRAWRDFRHAAHVATP
jgi:glycosyltransferase involved in cell wall biosynthesis